jgi:apolipoprotein N-acyltransferase
MKHLAIAFLAGLASATGFAPLGLWPLTILAFTILAWLLEEAPGLRSALARGWWFGMGQFVLGLNWIATAFTYQSAMPPWLGWVAVVALSLYLALFPAAAAGLAWRWGRDCSASIVLILAAAWTLTEWLRGTLFTGFAWDPVGVALLPTGLAWLAVWIGTYGLSAVTIFLGGLIRLLAGTRLDRRTGLAVAAAILVMTIGAWALRPALPETTGPAIRIVQPNIGQENRWDPELERAHFDRLREITGAPGAAPRLLFWPETAIPYDLREAGVQAAIAAVIGPRDLLLTGGIERAPPPEGVAAAEYNSLYALGPGARILGRYDKAHLVPYGEYLPMRPLLTAIGLSRLVPGQGDILAGPGPRTLDLPGIGRMGAQICYEMVFSGEVVDRANRPDFVFNPSNDAWFGAWGPPQHLAQGRMRALEEGLPLIRATPTGISAVVDAEGRVLASLPWRTAGVIDARLPPAAAPTLFARFGNLLSFAFALLLVAAAIAVRRKTR